MSPGLLFPSPNLMVLYHLENANDSSGNSKTLTNSGASFVTGIIGVGASLPTATSYLGRTDVAGFTLPGDLTFICSAKFATLPAASAIGILHSMENNGAWYGLKWGIYNNAGSYRMYAMSGDTSTLGTVALPLTTGIKHAFAITYAQTTKAIKLYYDGALVGSGTGGSTNDSSAYFRIGASASAAQAIIDEFAGYQEVKSAQWIRRYHAWAMGKL